jgi:hypothetical protein
VFDQQLTAQWSDFTRKTTPIDPFCCNARLRWQEIGSMMNSSSEFLEVASGTVSLLAAIVETSAQGGYS